jgi:hypothetical protein
VSVNIGQRGLVGYIIIYTESCDDVYQIRICTSYICHCIAVSNGPHIYVQISLCSNNIQSHTEFLNKQSINTSTLRY